MAATLTKPTNADYFLFAYDINIFSVDGAVAGEGVDFTICGYVEHRTIDANGHAECNVSTYLQALFANTTGVDEFATTTEVEISVETDGGLTDTNDYYVVFGASAAGEHVWTKRTTENVHYWPNVVDADNNPVQTLYCLRAYQSTFAGYVGSTLIEGSEQTPNTKGVVNINLQTMLGESGDLVREYWTRQGSAARVTKDRNIVRHTETNGIFLRWIDRNGCFRYWLFDAGKEERAGASFGNDFPIVWNEGGNQFTAIRAQGHTYTRQQDICAPMLDRDVFTMLCDLYASPNVCAYMQDAQAWQPVQLAGGKATWARDKHEKMQDFTATIIYPEYNVQSL